MLLYTSVAFAAIVAKTSLLTTVLPSVWRCLGRVEVVADGLLEGFTLLHHVTWMALSMIVPIHLAPRRIGWSLPGRNLGRDAVIVVELRSWMSEAASVVDEVGIKRALPIGDVSVVYS